MENQAAKANGAESIAPPANLSEEERWIVRMHGQDMGPFSSKMLYPKLLSGEIEPETLLLDQNRFTRCRLREIPEFQPYLQLHNTQNPVLLREQRAQERDEKWEKTGRKRMIMGISSAITLLIAVVVVWRVFIYKSGDVYLTDGDHEFSFDSFKGIAKQKQMRKNWKWKSARRKGRKGKKGTKATGPNAAAIDFTNDSSSGIPKAKLQSVIQNGIRSVFGCFKQRMEQDSRFSGGSIEFAINGTLGKIHTLKVVNTDYSSNSLHRCIRRKANRWVFPTFPGSAVVYFPVYIRKRRRW